MSIINMHELYLSVFVRAWVCVYLLWFLNKCTLIYFINNLKLLCMKFFAKLYFQSLKQLLILFSNLSINAFI